MAILEATNIPVDKDDDGSGINGGKCHTITAESMADSNGGDATLLNSPPPPTMKDIAHSQYDPSAAPTQDSWGHELAAPASLSETSKTFFPANGTAAASAVEDSLLSVGGPAADDDDGDAIDAYVDDDNIKALEVGYGDTAILRSPIEEYTQSANNNARAAYSAQTANAITLILQGRASQIIQDENGDNGDNGNTEEKGKSINSAITTWTSRAGETEISLGDRTAALLSVYSDYVRENNITNNDGPPKNPFANDSIDDNDVNIIHEEDDQLRIQMKEELKEVTFERFMSGLETQSYVDNYEDDDYYYDSDDVEYNNFEIDDMMIMEEDPNLNGTDWSTPAVVTHNTNSTSSNGGMTKKSKRRQRRKIPPPPPPKKRMEYYCIPTAASTIASFRLRADVALSAVTQKVNTVVGVTRGVTRTTIGSLEVVDDSKCVVIDDGDEKEEEEDNNDNASRRTDLEYGESSGDAIYGLHILERDMTRKKQSMKRKIGSNDSDNNDNGLDTFYETCDELGMTPKTHPGLHHFYRHHHYDNGHGKRFSSLKYQYPMFRSKRVRRCLLYSMTLILCALICVALVSSISNGFETIQLRNTPALPEDWRDELDWSVKQKDEWEKNHAQNINNIGDIQTTMNMTQLYHKISAAHRPVWYDRSTGWTGRTWDEAISFCNAHDNNIPCPYKVYCPNEKTLLPGIMDTDGVSWAPIMNAHNEWVQVGSGGTECALYSLFHNGNSPTWGEDGSSLINTKANTRHILCCREHPFLVEGSNSVDWVDSSTGTVGDANYGVIRPDGLPAGGDVNYPQSTVQDNMSPVTLSSSAELKQLFKQISRKYNPMWFDRESGWMGKTYQESLDFCANVWSGYIPCPYDAYCPGGRGKLLDGRIHEEGESWSAVIDDANDWVQVGVNGVCVLYSETELEKPSWGTTGNSNEEITRHIMCCQGAPYVDGLSLTLAGATDEDLYNSSFSTEVDSTSVMIPTQPMTEKEVAILDTLHPVWFSIIDGYTGTTYDDARVFCESNSHSNDSVGGGTYHICPLSAYCPNGPINTKPLYLQQDAFDGVQWAPISDNLNEFVMVGKIDDEDPLTCVTFIQMFNRVPIWGIDGSRPELKKHLLCCEDYTGYAFTPPKDKIASLITEEETTSNGMKEMKMTELEVQIQNLLQPMWFNNEEGWQGASYNDGQAFCESIPHGDGTLHLCPLDAYCPNGPRESEPLYLQMGVFDGDQWAPISDSFNSWVNIGKLEVEDPLTCLTHIEIFGHNPTWGLDGLKPELKDNILCCVDVIGRDAVNNDLSTVNSDSQSDSNTEVSHEGSAMVDIGKHAVDASIMNTFNPAWFSAARGGWDGGSHDDAVAFCEKFTGSHGKSMELCPHHAYCPQGPSMPVVGGHDVNFEEEGEQWAPIYGQQNHWVMIGNGGANVSSLCQSHVKLTGEEPLWGLDWSHKEMKKYVMCCSPFST